MQVRSQPPTEPHRGASREPPGGPRWRVASKIGSSPKLVVWSPVVWWLRGGKPHLPSRFESKSNPSTHFLTSISCWLQQKEFITTGNMLVVSWCLHQMEVFLGLPKEASSDLPTKKGKLAQKFIWGCNLGMLRVHLLK